MTKVASYMAYGLLPFAPTGRTVWPKLGLSIVLVVSPLCGLPFGQGSVFSPLRHRFLILHSILDILLDDHLVALRAACDTAAVATAMMSRSSLVVILAIVYNLNRDAHFVLRIVI